MRQAIIYLPKSAPTTAKALQKKLRRDMNVIATIIETDERELKWYLAEELPIDKIEEICQKSES